MVVVWTPCSLFGCVAARAFSGPAAHVPRAAPRAYGSWERRRPRRTATAGARACARSLSLFLSSLAFLPRAPPVTTPSRAAVPRAGRAAVTVALYGAPRRSTPTGRGSGYEGYPGSALLKIAKSGLAARTYAPAAVHPRPSAEPPRSIAQPHARRRGLPLRARPHYASHKPPADFDYHVRILDRRCTSGASELTTAATTNREPRGRGRPRPVTRSRLVTSRK